MSAVYYDTPLTKIKGIGPKRAQLLSSKNLYTAGDMLDYFPADYNYYDRTVSLAEAMDGQSAALPLMITRSGSPIRNGARIISHFQATDGASRIRLTWFNMPYLRKTLPPGARRIFRGSLRKTAAGELYMYQPQIFTMDEYHRLEGTIQPVYPLFKGMKNGQLIRLMSAILEDFVFETDYIPEADRESLGFCGRESAYRNIHFPTSAEDLRHARERLAFDEFFSFIFSVRKEKRRNDGLHNDRPLAKTSWTQKVIDALPYKLTDSQLQVWHEIEDDLSGTRVMNRLLQGDVGSGKTIIAFLALIMCAAENRQAAMMAPTEVLARQHMSEMTRMVEENNLPFHPVLLTGSVTGIKRKETFQQIEEGSAQIIIGTQALIQEKVQYHDLGLVITDEQHRFGVRQRESFYGKGKMVPLLVMSATPIPRTLALILYGDLSVSRLTQMPASRLPVKNCAVAPGSRAAAYRFIYRQIGEGHQAYIVCPAIEEGEIPGIENVKEYTEKVRTIFPPSVSIASMDGKMKPEEKQRIMRDFAARRIDILVSTSVIEVGINVPNATVMLVENAERFGLSQLHQLRGRVGRGKAQSYCIFIYSAGKDKPRRLEILEQSNDGFFIAEEDLKLRGAGDLAGVRQSGTLGFRIADIYQDTGIMNKAASYADRILMERPEISLPRMKSVDFRSI